MKRQPDSAIGYAVIGLGWISQAAMLPAFANARHNSRLVALVSGDEKKRRRRDDGELTMDNAFNFRGERRLGGDVFPEYDQFGPQLAYFSDCILGGGDPEPDGEEGRVDVRIIRALYDSLDAGRLVELDVRRDRRPTPDMAERYPAVEEPELIGAEEPSD